MTMLKWNIRQRFIYSWRHTKYHHNERMRNAIECSKEIYVYKSSIRYILFNIFFVDLLSIRRSFMWYQNSVCLGFEWIGKICEFNSAPAFNWIVEIFQWKMSDGQGNFWSEKFFDWRKVDILLSVFPSFNWIREFDILLTSRSTWKWLLTCLLFKGGQHFINIHYEDLYTHLFFFFFHFFLR